MFNQVAGSHKIWIQPFISLPLTLGGIIGCNINFFLLLPFELPGTKQKHTDMPAISGQPVNVCNKDYGKLNVSIYLVSL